MERVAISTSGSIGDMLVVTPYLTEMKRRFPHVKIYHIANSNKPYVTARSLFGESGLIDGSINIFHRNRFFFLLNLGVQRTRTNLLHWDCAIILEAGRNPEREEFKRLVIRRSLRMNCEIICQTDQNLAETSQPSGKYAVLNQVAAARPNFEVIMPEMQIRSLTYRMPFSRREMDICEHELASILHRKSGKALYALGTGGTLPAQRWPLSNYIRVAEHLYKTEGLIPCVIGSHESYSDYQQIAAVVPEAVPIIGYKLRTAIYALGSFAFYLGNDTGTLHAANAMGLRCIGIYGWNNPPGTWYPFGPRHTVYQSAYGTPINSIPPEIVIRHLKDENILIVDDRPIPFDFYCDKTIKL